MAKRELIDKSEVMMFVDDVFECQCNEKEAYELLDSVPTFTEQKIVKPYLEKLRADIEVAYYYLDGYDPDSLATFASRVDDLIDNLLSEQEVKE